MKRFLTVFAFTVAFVASCYPKDIVSPEPVWATQGGASNCERACVGLTVLGCPEGTPTEKGTSCVQMCERLSESRISAFRADCAATAGTKEQMRTCGVRCK